jgi:hypothetical protein
MPSWFKPAKRWVSHPLSIVVISVFLTAMASAILVPYLTGIWQVNEKELDVKFDLAKEVGDIVNSHRMKPLRYYDIDIDWNSSKSIEGKMPKIIEGQLEEIKSCNSMRQRLILYFPRNDKLNDEWADICASLSFYYQYKVIPRKLGFENDRFTKVENDRFTKVNNALKNLSMAFMNFVSNRLDLGLTKSDLENLAIAENSTIERKIQNKITNKTQNLMHNIINSDLVGY